MKKIKEILALIPARGNSKRLQRKNMRMLCGNPLFAYSIDAALKAKHITRVVVSTEDNEIAECSRESGAEIPFMRPPDLSQDTSKMSDVINFTLNKLYDLEGYEPEALFLLFPTFPFRTPSDLDAFTQSLNEGFSSVLSIRSHGFRPYSSMIQDNNNIIPLEMALPGTTEKQRESFSTYSNFSIKRLQPWSKIRHLTNDPAAMLDRSLELHFQAVDRGDYRQASLLKPIDSIRSIDIDTERDFLLAESIIEHKLFDFNASKPLYLPDSQKILLRNHIPNSKSTLCSNVAVKQNMKKGENPDTPIKKALISRPEKVSQILIPLFHADLQDDIDALSPLKGVSLFEHCYRFVRIQFPDSQVRVLALSDQVIDETKLQDLDLEVVRIRRLNAERSFPMFDDFLPGKIAWKPFSAEEPPDSLQLIISPYTIELSPERLKKGLDLHHASSGKPVLSVSETHVYPWSVFVKKDEVGEDAVSDTQFFHSPGNWYYDREILSFRDSKTGKILHRYQDFPKLFEPDESFLVIRAGDYLDFFDLLRKKQVLTLPPSNGKKTIMIRSWLDVMEWLLGNEESGILN